MFLALLLENASHVFALTGRLRRRPLSKGEEVVPMADSACR